MTETQDEPMVAEARWKVRLCSGGTLITDTAELDRLLCTTKNVFSAERIVDEAVE